MAIISTIAGTDIESGKTYRVTYQGSTPRYDGAVWEFKFRGRGGTAHGEIVHHSSSSVVHKYKGQDLYLSSGFTGVIEEVQLDTCIGSGADICRYGPAVVTRTPAEVAANPDARCGSCQLGLATWIAQQEAAQRSASIEDRLNAAIEGKTVVEAGPVITVPFQERERVVVTAADGTHPLAHRVPSIDVYDTYVSRTVDGVKDLDWLDYAASTQESILLEGPTESGKTRLIKAWCAKNGRPLVQVSCHGAFDATQLWGSKTILADGSIDYLAAETLQVIQHGGVLYLNEINFAPGKTLAVVHPIAEDGFRQVTIPDLGYQTFTVHPECIIVADYNPGYADTRELNEATKRRFTTKVWDYDETVERALIQRLPVLHDIKVAIRNVIATNDVETPLGPAKLMRFERHAIDLNLDYAITLFLDSFKAHERESIQEIVHICRDVLERQLEAIKETQNNS